jgi:hypothetical protein
MAAISKVIQEQLEPVKNILLLNQQFNVKGSPIQVKFYIIKLCSTTFSKYGSCTSMIKVA